MKITKFTLLEIFLYLLVGCGIGYVTITLVNFDWIGFMIALPLAIVSLKLLSMYHSYQLENSPLDVLELKRITDINSIGYKLEINGEESEYRWKDISSVRLNGDKKLSIKLNTGKKMIIGDEYSNWYLFINRIPKDKLYNNEIPEYLNQLSAKLKTCRICGKIAINKSACLSCGSKEYNESMIEEYGEIDEYIKEEQLFLFELIGEEEKVEFFLDEEDGFKLDPNWNPIVTEKEVIEYSKEP